jgi:hypothetical protein
MRHLELFICRCAAKGITKKIRNHSVQEYAANDSVEIRVDSRIQSEIKIKYNKPDIFILDKNKKEIIIIEVGITSFDNLLANHTGSLYKYKTRIIPYVTTWDCVVAKFHKQYRHDIGLDNRIQTYVRSRVLKMALESLTMESLRGCRTYAESIGEANRKKQTELKPIEKPSNTEN